MEHVVRRQTLENEAGTHAVVVVVEAEKLPSGGLRSIHAAPLVSQEPDLEKEKEVVGQSHDKSRTDAEVMVIAGKCPAVVGPSPEVIADIGI